MAFCVRPPTYHSRFPHYLIRDSCALKPILFHILKQSYVRKTEHLVSKLNSYLSVIHILKQSYVRKTEHLVSKLNNYLSVIIFNLAR